MKNSITPLNRSHGDAAIELFHLCKGPVLVSMMIVGVILYLVYQGIASCSSITLYGFPIKESSPNCPAHNLPPTSQIRPIDTTVDQSEFTEKSTAQISNKEKNILEIPSIDTSDWIFPKNYFLKKSHIASPILDGNINVSYKDVHTKYGPLPGFVIGGINSKKLKISGKSEEGEFIKIFKGVLNPISTTWQHGVKFDIEYLGKFFEISITKNKKNEGYFLSVRPLSASALELQAFDQLKYENPD